MEVSLNFLLLEKTYMKLIIRSLFLALLLSACTSTHNTVEMMTRRIDVGSGPEDMVIDYSSGKGRLLISTLIMLIQEKWHLKTVTSLSLVRKP